MTNPTLTQLRETLKAGLSSVGSWMQIPSTDVAEIMGAAGYDWVAVDLEHGSFTRSELPDIFRALSTGGTLPFARVADCTMTSIKGALDSGAEGLIFPMIETREQLDHAISLAQYPPNGTRGVGYCRANLFGKRFAEGVSANAELFFCAQIEHVRAIDNLSDILAHPALDAIMVGPYDLSGSMNLTGDFNHPDFLAALNRIECAAKKANIPMGLHVVQPDAAALHQKIEQGYQFIAYGIDSVFLYNSAERPSR